MDSIRDCLRRLGWPIDQLSDEQIADELQRRWFALRPETELEPGVFGLAPALGIVSTLSREGNLDALCWSDDVEQIPELPDALEEDLAHFAPASTSDQPFLERRRHERKPAKDLVTWSTQDGQAIEHTGWLVCRSVGGIAFIAEAEDQLEVGSSIEVRVHSRHGGTLELGGADVIRLEHLGADLTLVCVELEQALWSLEEPS